VEIAGNYCWEFSYLFQTIGPGGLTMGKGCKEEVMGSIPVFAFELIGRVGKQPPPE
jgi:hypothetical protein